MTPRNRRSVLRLKDALNLRAAEAAGAEEDLKVDVLPVAAAVAVVVLVAAPDENRNWHLSFSVSIAAMAG
jgi:hypothetical protein